MGIVNVKIPGSVHATSSAIEPSPAEWLTTRSINRTSCGTKNMKVKTNRPNSA